MAMQDRAPVLKIIRLSSQKANASRVPKKGEIYLRGTKKGNDAWQNDAFRNTTATEGLRRTRTARKGMHSHSNIRYLFRDAVDEPNVQILFLADT